MTNPIRLLFVDDDNELRKMWSSILTAEGFHVTDASTVPEALTLITKENFDALIADLNIGSPGDGFTVVSAMRRTQPEAVTLILTGYPAFQAALRAIHEQVDDFLTKPADPENLIARIRKNLGRRTKPADVVLQRLPQIISQNRQAIVDEWYSAVENHAELKAIKMSRQDRIDHLPGVLDELVRPRTSELGIQPAARTAATKHGRTRRDQGYTPAMLLEEARILHRVISDCVQKNLLHVDISMMLPDFVDVGDKLHLMSRHALEAFLSRDNMPDAA